LHISGKTPDFVLLGDTAHNVLFQQHPRQNLMLKLMEIMKGFTQ